MTEHERVRRRLLRKFTRLLEDCEQMIRDCQWWATNRPEHPPIDAEWFMVQAAGLRRCLAALERDQYVNPDWLQKS